MQHKDFHYLQKIINIRFYIWSKHFLYFFQSKLLILPLIIRKNNQMRIGILFICLLISGLLSSCKKSNTEEEQLQKLKKSFTYKSYYKLSKTTLPILIKSYNSSQTSNNAHIAIEDARLLTGYSWAISGKTTLAIAEAELIKEKNKDNTVAMLASSLLAIAYYEKEWEKLAQEQNEMANALINKEPESKLQIKIMVYHLLLGSYCIYEKDYSAAKFHFAGLAILTGTKWPYSIVEAIDDIEKGNVQQGLIKINAISKDELVPHEVRIALSEGITIVEKNTGDINSKLFWTKIISRTILTEMKKALYRNYKNGFDKIEKFTSQFPTN